MTSAQRTRYQVGYGLYGMRTSPIWRASGTFPASATNTAKSPFDPGGIPSPACSREPSAEIRRRIGDLGMTLVDVMEGMQPASNATIEENLERLRAAAEVAHRVLTRSTRAHPEPIGGRPGAFMERREAMAGELCIWASKLDELDVTFCIKPHSKQTMGVRKRSSGWCTASTIHV